MDIEELKKDTSVKDWFILIKPKPITETNYLRALKLYCDFIGKTPNELINEADAEAEAGILLKRRTIRRYLLSYIDHLNQSDDSPNTTKLRFAVVKSFYKKLDVELPNLPRNETEAVPLIKNTKIPNKDDIGEALQVCDLLEKAVILAGVSSGLASNELRNLKVSDFKDGHDPETEITTLEIRREKTTTDHITFFSPECSRAIQAYLDFRQNRTIKETDPNRERQLEKQRIFSDDGYLFILSRIPDSWLKDRNEEERKFKRNTFMEIYRSISLKAELNSPKGDFNLIRSHNLRRFFNSALKNAGADSQSVEFWMGHKLNKTLAGYFRSDAESQKKIYQKFVPYLTIEKSLDVSVAPEYQNAIEEIRRLKAENERVSVERIEVQELKKSVDELYRKIWDTPEGYELGVNVIKKLHPHRIILPPPPAPGSKEEAEAEEEHIKELQKEYAEKGYIDD